MSSCGGFACTSCRSGLSKSVTTACWLTGGGTTATAGSGADQDSAAVRNCPHCGSGRLSLVKIYHTRQQIPGFLLPQPEAPDTS